ncbi:MAG: adaptor protein MecA [Lachnospiraceae bacterium]|nr:adaptor protein MecA [Lachnospiraceae bacterium]
MKIEKISETQIKCTLNKQDLSDRELQLTELAYGTEKVRALFSELLIQASYECGFEAHDVPLMIEAVPMSKDSLVLILTKVTDPEELNVNYSNISMPSKKNQNNKPISLSPGLRADEILKEAEAAKLFHIPPLPSGESKSQEETRAENLMRVLNESVLREFRKNYVFEDLSMVLKLVDIIGPFYSGTSTLYKIPETARYCLSLAMSDTTPAQFNKVCNICAEYGEALHTPDYSKAYFDEHYKIIINNKAIERLKLLNKH